MTMAISGFANQDHFKIQVTHFCNDQHKKGKIQMLLNTNKTNLSTPEAEKP